MPRGYRHTEEAKEKIRRSKLGVPRPDLVGKLKSKKTRQKISQALTGKKKNYPVWNKGKKIFYNRGENNVMHRPEVKKKLSRAVRGEKHWNWQGGIYKAHQPLRRSLRYKMWRSAVFKRDKFACVNCGARNGRGKNIVLQADHIKPFSTHPKERFLLKNGRTLCLPCHRKTPSYGKRL